MLLESLKDSFYRDETKRLSEIIGDSEMSRLYEYPKCELEHDFLGFIHVYTDLSSLPSYFTIIDFGCYQALQGAYFKHCKSYIGIDDVPIEWRLRTSNADYYYMKGQYFTGVVLPRMINEGLDLKKVMAICSYVPDEELRKMVSDVFPYHRVQYGESDVSEKIPQLRV